MFIQITENVTGQIVKLQFKGSDTIGDFTDNSCFLGWKTVENKLGTHNQQILQNHSLQTNFPLTFAPRENPVIRGSNPAFNYKKPPA
jgi:hypothetical protein